MCQDIATIFKSERFAMSALLEYSAGTNLKTYLFVMIVLCLLLFFTACPENQQSKAQPVFIEALSDFVFVGAGIRDLPIAPAHNMKPVSLPAEFRVGYQYVFHYRRSSESGEIYKILRERLQSKGIKITSPDVTMDRYQGGPAFRISFEDEGFKGVIFNTLDGQIINNESLSKDWTEDDYILFLEYATH